MCSPNPCGYPWRKVKQKEQAEERSHCKVALKEHACNPAKFSKFSNTCIHLSRKREPLLRKDVGLLQWHFASADVLSLCCEKWLSLVIMFCWLFFCFLLCLELYKYPVTCYRSKPLSASEGFWIIELFWWERIMKTTWFQFLCHGQELLLPDQVAQSLTHPGLEQFQW